MVHFNMDFFVKGEFKLMYSTFDNYDWSGLILIAREGNSQQACVESYT